jgi:hypothetical protein
MDIPQLLNKSESLTDWIRSTLNNLLIIHLAYYLTSRWYEPHTAGNAPLNAKKAELHEVIRLSLVG